MFLTAGGFKIPASELDQHISIALHLLAAFADPAETKKVAAEVTRIRDEAIEYAGKLEVLKNAQQLESDAKQQLIQAQAQAAKTREDARAAVEDLKKDLANLRDELFANQAELKQTIETADKAKRETDAYYESRRKEADKLTVGAKNILSDAEIQQDNARELKEEYERKIAALKQIVGG